MKTAILNKLSVGLISSACLLFLYTIINDCTAEQRNEISYLRGKYNQAFFYRHNDSYRYSAAFHYHHGKQHDVLQLTALVNHHQVDIRFDGDVTAFTYYKTARTEPTMELYGPYTAQMAWRVYGLLTGHICITSRPTTSSQTLRLNGKTKKNGLTDQYEKLCAACET